MASAKKVAWAQLKVGVVAAIALALLVVLVFLITGETTFFRERVKIFMFLSDSAALTRGANVRYNGILIGRVTKVELSGETDPKRLVRVEMEVDRAMLPQIPANSEAFITAENVLGTKYINIKRGTGREMAKAGGELPARDVTGYEEVVQGGYNVLVAMQGTLKRVDALVGEVERGRGSIGKLIYDAQLYNNLNATAIEARKITAQINSGKGSISKLFYEEAFMDDMRQSLARFNALLDGLQQGQGTAGRLLKDTTLHDDLKKTLAEYRTVAADLNSGKGTAGKLLKDEATIKQLNATMARLDTLIDRINSGQGTLGQLMVNPQLYESLNGTTREVHQFMKDFRANPKKFLSIKLGLF